MEFCRQEYLSGLPFPSPGDLPDPGTELGFSALQVDSLSSELPGKSYLFQFSSVAQSCLTLCDPLNRSTPGLPVHHQLPEFTQTHVHRVGDAIQPSHPLSSPSPPAPNPSQHQGLFQWVNSSHEVAEVLEFQLPMNTQDWSPLGWIGWISLQSKGLKSLPQHHSSKASIFWHSAFFTVQLSHPYITTGKTIALTRRTFVWQSNVSAF